MGFKPVTSGEVLRGNDGDGLSVRVAGYDEGHFGVICGEVNFFGAVPEERDEGNYFFCGFGIGHNNHREDEL